MGKRKPVLKVPYNSLLYGKEYGVNITEAKRAFLSGMSKRFRRKVNVKFTR